MRFDRVFFRIDFDFLLMIAIDSDLLDPNHSWDKWMETLWQYEWSCCTQQNIRGYIRHEIVWLTFSTIPLLKGWSIGINIIAMLLSLENLLNLALFIPVYWSATINVCFWYKRVLLIGLIKSITVRVLDDIAHTNLECVSFAR